jgi:hypothetical protein
LADFLGNCFIAFPICPLTLQKCAFRYFGPIRCGSLGITNFAINEINSGIVGIIIFGAILYGARFLISVVRIVWLGIVLWCIGLVVAALTLGLLLGTFANLLHNPPPLPLNRSDTKACREFIFNLNAMMPYAPNWYNWFNSLLK